MRAGVRGARARGASRRAGAAPRRDRHRQGAGGARRSTTRRRARDGPFVVVDCGALARDADRERAVRPRARARSPAPTRDRQGAFARRTAARCSSTRSASSRSRCSPSSCACSRRRGRAARRRRKTRALDVRVVAATHRDLRARSRASGFRGDLSTGSRWSRSTCRRCAQRHRGPAALIATFLERARRRAAAAQVGGADARALQRYDWPGNVRELRNVIERAVALAGTDDDFQSLPLVLRPTAAAPEAATARADRPFHEAKDEVVNRFEREYLTDLVAPGERKSLASGADRRP